GRRLSDLECRERVRMPPTAKVVERRGIFLTSTQVSALICERIAVDGLALRQICQDASMSSRSTLFLWLRQHPDFREKYARSNWLLLRVGLNVLAFPGPTKEEASRQWRRGAYRAEILPL